MNPRTLELVEEFKRRDSHPIKQYSPGSTPGWDQLSFHKSLCKYRLAFGGNRSGKSYLSSYEIACWLRGISPYRKIPDPPNKIWVISVEYSIILAGIYEHLVKLIPDWEIDKIGANVPNTQLPAFIRLKNGSQVDFKSAKGLGDDTRRKFQAANIDLIAIDEEIDDTILIELEARTLDRGGQFIISATLVESYDWIVRMEELADKGHKDYFSTRLHTTLNPYLNAEAVEQFENLLSDDDKQVRLYGKSRRATGLVYNTFDQGVHCIKPFTIPPEWPRWNALDPGIRVFAGLWLACSPENKWYIYREMYLTNTPLWEVSLTIKEAEGWTLNKKLTDTFEHCVWDQTPRSERMVSRLIDDKRGSRLITGDEGVLDQLYSKYGIVSIPAEKAKRPGIEAVRHALEGRLFFFENLEKTIWEMRRYRIRDVHTRKNHNEPIDEPIKKDDHLMDTLRYLIMENPRYEFGSNIPKKTGYSLETHMKRVGRKRQYVDELLGTEI